MGTNFYLHEKESCECCGRPFEPLHIGKSSYGWCFALHVMPLHGIRGLDDWRKLWSKPDVRILDEYGKSHTPEEMEATITRRKGYSEMVASWAGYASKEAFHRQNHSEDGPNGLIRSKLGGNCVEHGEGTWDCITGDFS